MASEHGEYRSHTLRLKRTYLRRSEEVDHLTSVREQAAAAAAAALAGHSGSGMSSSASVSNINTGASAGGGGDRLANAATAGRDKDGQPSRQGSGEHASSSQSTVHATAQDHEGPTASSFYGDTLLSPTGGSIGLPSPGLSGGPEGTASYLSADSAHRTGRSRGNSLSNAMEPHTTSTTSAASGPSLGLAPTSTIVSGATSSSLRDAYSNVHTSPHAQRDATNANISAAMKSSRSQLNSLISRLGAKRTERHGSKHGTSSVGNGPGAGNAGAGSSSRDMQYSAGISNPHISQIGAGIAHERETSDSKDKERDRDRGDKNIKPSAVSQHRLSKAKREAEQADAEYRAAVHHLETLRLQRERVSKASLGSLNECCYELSGMCKSKLIRYL